MPFAPRIRKDILKALDNHIIPALWRQNVPLAYVAPSLLFPKGIYKSLLNARLPRRDAVSPGFPIQTLWTKAQLHSTVHPYLSFVYEGNVGERTLINATQSSQYKISKGIYTIHGQAPVALYYPAAMPRNTGAHKSRNQSPNSLHTSVRILQVAFRDKILVHTHTQNLTEIETSHSLQIEDTTLLTLARIFHEELHDAPEVHQEIAQAALLTFMLRLRYQLATHSPSLANTSHPPIAELAMTNRNGLAVCQQAIYFIQTHLHEHLSLPLIAQQVNLSSSHLNRLFRQFNGASVMHYVRQQRINAAKKILMEGSESVKEIAILLNFKRAAAFCSAFRQETGMTPLQFRRQFASDKSTFSSGR